MRDMRDTLRSTFRRAFRLENLALYLRAVRNAVATLAARMRDPNDKAELERTVAMADRFLKAQAATLHSGGSRQ